MTRTQFLLLHGMFITITNNIAIKDKISTELIMFLSGNFENTSLVPTLPNSCIRIVKQNTR